MTVAEVAAKIKKRFADAEIDTPLLDAQLIIGKAANMNKAKLLTYPDKELSDDEIEKIKEMCVKRIKRMPMQYILGMCEFMGLNFKVNKSTLIPRGDTEVLVEKAINIIYRDGFKSVLDIGTGSGAIAVSIAKYTDTDVTAVDISDGAIETAKENAKNNHVNVRFIKSDLFKNVEGKYDIILSNPPYIEKNVIKTLQPDVKDYEPISALDGGDDGLDFYRRIINDVNEHLNDKGCIIFEIGYNQGKAVKKLLEEAGFKRVAIKKDLAGHDRVVISYKVC